MKELSIKVLIGQRLIRSACKLLNNKDKSKFASFRYHLLDSCLKCFGFSIFSIESIEKYKQSSQRVDQKEVVPSRIGYSGNIIIRLEDEPALIPSPLPSINQNTFHNVVIQGHSDLVVDVRSRIAINDMCYNLDGRIVFYDSLIYRLSSNVCILRSNFRNLDTIKSGIMISGKFSNNYYHAIIENLIRVLYVKGIPEDIPLIVDEPIIQIPSLKAILDILTAKTSRTIIPIKKKPYSVETLYTIDHPNHIVPHVIMPQFNLKQEDFVYDFQALKELKSQLLEYRAKHKYYTRIFISRNNSQRRHFNEKEVFSALEPYGFVKVAPEEYNIYEQMALFNDADVIIGGSGAALTNMLFCHEGCCIICLQRSIHNNTHVFSPLAYFNHCRIRYYGEDVDATNDTNVHNDFYIDAKRLEVIVNQEISRQISLT